MSNLIVVPVGSVNQPVLDSANMSHGQPTSSLLVKQCVQWCIPPSQACFLQNSRSSLNANEFGLVLILFANHEDSAICNKFVLQPGSSNRGPNLINSTELVDVIVPNIPNSEGVNAGLWELDVLMPWAVL